MARITIGVSVTVVPLVTERVYRFTPAVNCTMGIGPNAAGRVAHDHRYAQLQAGVTYEFITAAGNQHMAVLSRRDPGDLDYVNDRVRPA